MSEPKETFTFQAIWPITAAGESMSYGALCLEAEAELPDVIARTRAALTRPGRFSIAPSSKVAGSGNTTASVLLYEAPARRAVTRPYHRRLTRADS